MKKIKIFDVANSLIQDDDSPISAHGLKNGDSVEARTKVPRPWDNVRNPPIYPD